MASWATALFAGWALVAGLAADTPGHPVRRSAERALVASAIAALVAAGALAALLVAGDFTISYVARSITQNLATPYRVGALWNLPAGAVLPTASLVAMAGWIVARRSPASPGLAAAAAIVVALCAASLAASPFATLPWRPTDGLGLRPALQHPLSVLGAIALSLAVAASAARLAAAASALADAPVAKSARPLDALDGAAARTAALDPSLVLTATALAIAIWSTTRGSFEAGVSATPSPLSGDSGVLVAAASALVLAWRARTGSTAATFTASLGLVGILSAILLGAVPRPGSTWTTALFPSLSLVVAIGGALAAERANGTLLERALGIGGVVAVGFAGYAAVRIAGMAPGARVPPVATCFAAGAACLVCAAAIRRAASEAWLGWAIALAALVGSAVALALSHAGAWSTVLWSAVTSGGAALAIVCIRGRSRGDARLALVALAAAFAASAAAGEGWGTRTAATVAGGASTVAPAPIGDDFVLAHQGISRYEDGNAHVEAVALEVTRGGEHRALLSADRREYVDSRDELLGPATRRPAILTTPLQELRVHLDDVAADETASLRLVVVPLAIGWLAAPVCLVLLSASLLLPTGATRSPYASTDIVLA